MATSKPIYGVGGLITGYSGTGRSYLPKTNQDVANDYPQWGTDAAGKSILVSAQTGKPYTGAIPTGFSNAGTMVQNGQLVPTPATQPKLPEFTTIKTIKQPEIAGAIPGLIKQQQDSGAALTKSFTDYLKEARDINAANKTQLTKDQAAFDTSEVEAGLPAINRNYQANQEGLTAEQAARNRAYAGQTEDQLARLTAENQNYESRAQAVADRAVQEAIKRNSLYQLGTGTPKSGSGDLTNRAIRAYSDINIPLQRELSARRYGQITDIERPWERELYGNDIALLNRRSGLEGDYAERNAGTVKYLQGLRAQMAGLSRAQAESYLRSLQIPFDVGQRILTGDIANLAGIQRLDELANYYTAATPYDASRVPATPFYSAGGLPGRNYTPQDATDQFYQDNPHLRPAGYDGGNGAGGGNGDYRGYYGSQAKENKAFGRSENYNPRDPSTWPHQYADLSKYPTRQLNANPVGSNWYGDINSPVLTSDPNLGYVNYADKNFAGTPMYNPQYDYEANLAIGRKYE